MPLRHKFPRLLLVFVLLAGSNACSHREPPHQFNDVETLVMNRPESAAIICRFKTYASGDTVWQRITTERGLKRWAADSVRVELSGGGMYRLVTAGGQRQEYVIRSFVTGKKFTVEGPKGSWMSWQIEKLSNGTRVTFASNGVTPEWREQLEQHKASSAAFVKRLVNDLGAGSAL
jgi:uncharacterized protein YndB with AHSA1/START domain